jgi:phospholipase C
MNFMEKAFLFTLLILTTTLLDAQIQHIVVIVKENHSFDNYFGRFPGANGSNKGRTPTGTVTLAHMSDTPYNCGHSWGWGHAEVDGGKMDGFTLCYRMKAYVQAWHSDIPNYWAYAQTYGLADNMFAQLNGPSMPNHSYIFAESGNDAVDNPRNVISQQKYGWGCDAARVGATVHSIDPTTGTSFYQPPCFTIKTMAQVLDSAGVSWKVYAPQPGTSGYVWNFVSYFHNLWTGTERVKSVPNSQFALDIANRHLPNVSWIIPPIGVSEHPPESIRNGESWTVQTVNYVMNSPYWSSTLIVITWDDWGGFSDHVPPPTAGFFGFGIRVPLLVISPYAKRGHVGHHLYSFDSINKTIENVFNTPCLVADCNVAVNDLSDMLTITPAAPAMVLVPRPFVPDPESVTIDNDGENED